MVLPALYSQDILFKNANLLHEKFESYTLNNIFIEAVFLTRKKMIIPWIHPSSKTIL